MLAHMCTFLVVMGLKQPRNGRCCLELTIEVFGIAISFLHYTDMVPAVE